MSTKEKSIIDVKPPAYGEVTPSLISNSFSGGISPDWDV